MPDHRSPIFSRRGRNRRYRGRHTPAAVAELAAAAEPELELEPVPEHVQGVQVGGLDRVPLELHLAGAAAGDNDRSDGMWRA